MVKAKKGNLPFDISTDMELLREELREQKMIVKQQKKEIQKLKIQNAGLLEKLSRYENKPNESDSDSDIEILESEPVKSFSSREISKFQQLNLRSGVELDNIPVYDLENFVAIVTEKSNQTRVKLPKPPEVRKNKKRRKRASSVLMVEIDSSDDNNNETSDEDLEYYKNTCKFQENSKSSKNLRKLINAGKHLKSKIKAGARLPDGVELVNPSY